MVIHEAHQLIEIVMVKEEEVVLVREIDYEDVDHVLDQGQDQDQSKNSKVNKQLWHYFKFNDNHF